MKKLVSFIFIFTLLFSSNLLAEEESFQPSAISRKPLILAKGFSFKGQEYRVTDLRVFEVSLKNLKTNQTDGQPRIVGHIELAAQRFMLKVISPSLKKFEADIVKPSEEKDLNVPIGHVSLIVSQPDKKNTVMTGELRIVVEDDKELSGEYKSYLNLKPMPKESNEEDSQTQTTEEE